MEILGLIDTLESLILDGTKIPLTKKALVDEDKILALIDKIRLVCQGGGGFAQGAIASKAGAKEEEKDIRTAASEVPEALEGRPREEAKAVEVLQQAYQMAKEIREGADKYADEVLANLEATSTRILRTINAGRERLQKTTQEVESK